MKEKVNVITLCGSSRFVGEMAVVSWLLERDEKAVCMGLHLLPWWYSPDLPEDHLAEYEGCADEMDALHLKKIELSDEVFVIDANVNGKPYISSSTKVEIEFAESLGLPVRRLSLENAIRIDIYSRMATSVDNAKAATA